MRPSRHGRVEEGHRLRVPPQLDVALVAHDDRPRRTGPPHDLGHALRREDLARGVARGVQPDQRCPVDGLGLVRCHELASGEHRPDRVGRVGDPRDGHPCTGRQAQQSRQRRHELLGPDGRDDRVGGHLGAQAAREPPRACRAQFRPAGRGGVARCVGGRCQRRLHDLGGGIDGSADREVDDALGMEARELPVGRKDVPGEVGQRVSDPRPSGCAQCSCSCGGTLASRGASKSWAPSLAAPPGDPRSTKNSAFAAV